MSDKKSYLQTMAEGEDKERSIAAIKALGSKAMGTEIGMGIIFGLGVLGFAIIITF